MDEGTPKDREDGEAPPAGPAELIGTPPPPTVSGDQFAGAQTGAQPAEPEDAEA